MSIGKNVLKYRKESGLSQVELAEQTMLSLRTIQRIENDKNRPRGYTIKVIAEVLKVETTELTEEQAVNPRMLAKRIESINLSVLLFVIVPFGNLIFPIVLWNRYSYHELADRVGRAVINFQITWSLISYFLLAISPFLARALNTTFPIIFAVLTAAYVINISVVIRTARRIKSKHYEVSKWALELL
ncbi:MAG: helix-turn-helix domain-containing protein [Roseivirga sp.]|nr:helix-turn-helix domain-containing protein [Roseivirga sp.]